MLITEPNKLEDFLKTFDSKCLAFDTETDSLDWFTQNIKGLSLYDGHNSCYIYFTPENWHAIWKLLWGLFLRAKQIIGHNLVFDFKVLKRVSPAKVDSILQQVELIDTMIAEYILNPDNSRGLKYLVYKYTGKLRKTWKEMQRFAFDSQEMVDYCQLDSKDSWDLWQFQRPLLVKNQQMQIFNIDCAFIPVQIEMETTGVLVDKSLLAEQETKLDLLKCELEEKMCVALGMDLYYQGELFGGDNLLPPVKFSSPKEISQIVIKKLGMPLKKNPKTSNYSVGNKVIADLLDVHPFFPLYQKYQAVRKLLDAFVKPYWDLIRPDGRIYPSFRHVKSGRCVSYKPNLQQLAKLNNLVPDVNVRSLFIF